MREPTKELEDQAGREIVTFAHGMREPRGVPPTPTCRDVVKMTATSKLKSYLGWSEVSLAKLVPEKTARSLFHTQQSSGSTRTQKTGASKPKALKAKN